MIARWIVAMPFKLLAALALIVGVFIFALFAACVATAETIEGK